MARTMTRVTIAIEPEMLERIDRLAAALRVSPSRWIQDAMRDQIEESELGVKVLTDPVLGQKLLEVFGDRQFISSMVQKLKSEVNDRQLGLFAEGMERLLRPNTASKEPEAVKGFKGSKGGKRK